MRLDRIFDEKRLDRYVGEIMDQNAKTTRLDGWFLGREILMEEMKRMEGDMPPAMRQAVLLNKLAERIPISIRPGEIFAGTEADAFARSYALIKPEFRVDTFEGYCDEDAVYGDIEPNETITKERIEAVRRFWSEQPFAKMLSNVYTDAGLETKEVVYFVERVTGHVIPDFRDALGKGIGGIVEELEEKKKLMPERSDYLDTMATALRSATILAKRYAALAEDMAKAESDPSRKAELEQIARSCRNAPENPATNLHEAIQGYILCWQVMNLEQSPNPFAFSVGNLDRALMPYYDERVVSRGVAVQMLRHLLAFFCVGDRSWAISQNIVVGGMDENLNDLTNEMTYMIVEAFRLSNYAQPNLSVKLHKNTPLGLYRSVADSFFEFGHSTPSFFNDHAVFKMMREKGILMVDMPIYGVAGCQEPHIMGKESGNTTNSWLNLAKILELALNDGVSMISSKRIAPTRAELGLPETLNSHEDARAAFFGYLDYFLPRMAAAANRCTEALSLLPTPFLSTFLGGRETGHDVRDAKTSGSPYGGSGCLIHGLGTVADSLSAVKTLYSIGDKFGFDATTLTGALRADFAGHDALRDFLMTKSPRYGNNDDEGDRMATELLEAVSGRVNSLKNPVGRNFTADWSSPSTNLLYGHWTGATPNGRHARTPLSYGIDPQPGAATRGLLARTASQIKLNTKLMTGGSASAMTVNPDQLKGKTIEDKTEHLQRILTALFAYNNGGGGMLYTYFNVYSTETLRDVLEHPEKYPNPVIVRIHGQYADARHLSPDILRDDVIPKIDPMSTSF